YEALSYMWGSEEYPILLDVDGHERFIRNNLWQALKHLRYPNKKRILWVDAICIDQSNNKERGHQVAQMSEIYAQATNVRLWLGLDDKDGSVRATFDHLKNWRRIGHRHRLSHPTRHLQELCTRPYWSRLWIIQEIVLATRITVQCGYSICD
ncbi:heterokaryon incompatibility, partial [Acephala macrosclerotiorum]